MLSVDYFDNLLGGFLTHCNIFMLEINVTGLTNSEMLVI